MTEKKIEVKKPQLVDSQGREIKQVTMPVIKIGEHTFAFDTVRAEEKVDLDSEKGVRPGDIVKELRALEREVSHRFTLLAAALAAATKGIDNLEEFLTGLGLEVVDIQGKKFYSPKQ
jgi:hypothetical protein